MPSNTVEQVLQTASAAYQASAFGTGFLEGYNTLDALASVAFSVIAVQTLKQLGFSSKKRRRKNGEDKGLQRLSRYAYRLNTQIPN